MVMHNQSSGETGAVARDDDRDTFKQLFELSPDPTWIIEGNRFVECNEAAIRTLGYASRDELLNVHPSELSPQTQPDGQDSYVKAESMMALARTHGLHRFEWTHTQADGTDFLAEVTLSAIQLVDRQVIYCVWRDIIERNKAEIALRESQQRYSDLVENTPDLITSVDAQGRFVFINKSAEIIYGLAPQECIGLSAFDFVHPDDRQATQKAFAEWVQSPRGTLSFENRQLSRHGVVHVMQLNIVARHSVTGEVCGFDSVARDVTESKQTTEKLEARDAYLTAIIENQPGLIWLKDVKGRFLAINHAFAVSCGREMQDLLGKTDLDIWPRELAEKYIADDAKVMQAGRPIMVEELIQDENEPKWFETFKTPIKDSHGNIIGSTGYARDITERKQAQAERQRLLSIIDDATDFISASNMDGRLLFLNAAGALMVGHPVGVDVATLEIRDFHPQWAARRLAEEAIPAALKDGSWQGECALLHRDGHEIPTSQMVAVHRDHSGKPLYMSTIIRDITERQQMEERVRQMAFHDTLTQLPNRRLLEDRLSQSMAASSRSGVVGALMFLDLDDFKLLNDTHGHTVGDLLLIEAAERLKSCVREVDTVARFGGDEFVVVISDLSVDRSQATAQAQIIAEKIGAALGEPYVLKLQRDGQATTTVEHSCTASIGVALFGKDETIQEDIFKQADMAMYQAKEAGSNLIRFFEDGR